MPTIEEAHELRQMLRTIRSKHAVACDEYRIIDAAALAALHTRPAPRTLLVFAAWAEQQSLERRIAELEAMIVRLAGVLEGPVVTEETVMWDELGKRWELATRFQEPVQVQTGAAQGDGQAQAGTEQEDGQEQTETEQEDGQVRTEIEQEDEQA